MKNKEVKSVDQVKEAVEGLMKMGVSREEILSAAGVNEESVKNEAFEKAKILVDELVEMGMSKEEILSALGVSKKPKSKPRGKKVMIACALEGCGNQKEVRVADVNRGLGRFCCRSCASKQREIDKKKE